jgi:hypothetical protein
MDGKENPWLVAIGLIVASAVVAMMLWAAFETDPQYRQPPSYVTTNTESEASND